MERVDLAPGRNHRLLRDGLEGHARLHAHDVASTHGGRAACGGQFALGMEQALMRDRGQQDRIVEGLLEQRQARVRA